jgi:hypothetical protein
VRSKGNATYELEITAEKFEEQTHEQEAIERGWARAAELGMDKMAVPQCGSAHRSWGRYRAGVAHKRS